MAHAAVLAGLAGPLPARTATLTGHLEKRLAVLWLHTLILQLSNPPAGSGRREEQVAEAVWGRRAACMSSALAPKAEAARCAAVAHPDTSVAPAGCHSAHRFRYSW